MLKRMLCLILFLFVVEQADAKAFKSLVSDDEANKAIKEFAREMAEKHQFDEQTILQQLSSLAQREDIISRISKPAESLPWYRYRSIFMSEKRIDAGVEFWQQHAATLDKAATEFGVDPAIIVGIIGVETFYGRIQGDFPVIEALHTLGFFYPKRSAFFRSELAQFYLLARDQEWPLEEIRGSYAGAMGMGQFISSSYRHYGIDFNQDGKINLFSDPVDMIGSVANYFSRHGWRENGFVAEPIKINAKQKFLVQKQLQLKRPLADFRDAKVNVEHLENRTDVAGIFAFEAKKGHFEHWLSGHNFYVITRYNHSHLYALAAFQLSMAIEEKRAMQQSVSSGTTATTTSTETTIPSHD